jgi:pimeloyl-ACP methyl ester carboxylesterase
VPAGLERRFPVYGQTLAGLYWDGQGVPMLALHGWLDNAASFIPLAEHLPGPLLALDFAGHGLSDHRPAGLATHLVDHVRDVLEVADQLGWQRFVLIGHSMGAGVASLFAATFPERVSHLVLLEGLGPPATDAGDVAPTLRTAIDQMRGLAHKRKPLYRDPGQAVAARLTALGGLEEHSARLLCERGLVKVEDESEDGWTWRTDIRLRTTSSLRLTEQQVEGFVRRIRAPTLLVLAGQGLGGDGRFAHREAWLAHLTRVDLPGRHQLHMDDPVPVAAAIRRFLAEAS